MKHGRPEIFAMHHVLISILILAALVGGCKSNPKMDDTQILEALGIQGGKILTNRYINLDADPALETAAVAQKSDGEVLAVFDKKDGNWSLVKRWDFHLPQYGPYKYVPNIEDYVPAGEQKGIPEERIGHIFSRLTIEKVVPEKTNSLIFSFLGSPAKSGQGAGIGFIEDNIWIIKSERGSFRKVLDFRRLTAGDEYWPTRKRLTYELLKDGTLITRTPDAGDNSQPVGKGQAKGKGKAGISSGSPAPLLQIVNNGKDYVAVRPGQSYVRMYDAAIEKLGGNKYRFVFNGKNKGAFAVQAFVTLSFIGAKGGSIKVLGGSKNSVYNPGQKVHNFKGPGKIAVQHPVVEFNKSPWQKNYRLKTAVEFEMSDQQPAGGWKPGVLIRFAFRNGNDYNYIPGEAAGAFAKVDQQGKPAYFIGLETAREAVPAEKKKAGDQDL